MCQHILSNTMKIRQKYRNSFLQFFSNMKLKCLYHPICRYKRVTNKPCCNHNIIDVIKTAAAHQPAPTNIDDVRACCRPLFFVAPLLLHPPCPLTCFSRLPSSFPGIQSDRCRHAAGALGARRGTPSLSPSRQGSERSAAYAPME